MYSVIKRFFDIVVSLAALVLLSPFLIPICFSLKLTGEGYIWYLQERIGYKNKPFKIFKFATMLKDSPNMPGGLITTRKDPRLTPLGPFLRSSKINELPQLINILNGDMSFVGPRPVMPKSFEVYPEEIKKIIYNVKPGLTGIGSILFRDEEELLTKIKNEGSDPWVFYSEILYPFKGKVEKWYQEKRGFWTDVLCLFLTAWVIFFPTSRLIYKVFKTLPDRTF